MELNLTRQAMELAIGAAMGLGCGLVYDLLRCIRWRSGKIAAVLCDFLFCLMAAAAAFLYGITVADGKLGIWNIACWLLGFGLYTAALSPIILPILDKFMAYNIVILKIIGKITKKSAETAKSIFQKTKECFIIKRQADAEAAERYR